MRSVNVLRTAAILMAWALLMRGQDSLQATRAKNSGEEAIQGAYENIEYGYAVNIPDHLKAYRMRAPSPQHGFAIRLRGAEIWVNGEYDATGIGSLQALGTKTVSELSASDRLRLRRIGPTKLGGLPARELVLANDVSATLYRRVHVVTALRAVPGSVAIIYTVGLRTETDNTGLEKLFSTIVNSFRLRSLPN